MSRLMKMAMLNQSRKNNQDNQNNPYESDYKRNQIGFQYPDRRENNNPYADNNGYERHPDTYNNQYMESEPIWARRRDNKGRYIAQSPYDYPIMHHESNYSENSIPMAGYLGISYSVQDNSEKMDKEQAEQWTREMKNEDGSKGPRWSFDEIKKIMKQQNIDCDPISFYATMNMLYSDYGEVFQKHDVATISFYADMAKAFLDDKDAVKNKLEQYYKYVVKH